jgi:hypothetical protein
MEKRSSTEHPGDETKLICGARLALEIKDLNRT